MTPTLPFTDGDLARLSASSRRAKLALNALARPFEDQLVAALANLKSVYESADQYGPSSEMEEAGQALRLWFMHHYGPVRSLFREMQSQGNPHDIATWSLESSAAEKLYRLLAAEDFSVAPMGWAPVVRQAMNLARRARRVKRA